MKLQNPLVNLRNANHLEFLIQLDLLVGKSQRVHLVALLVLHPVSSLKFENAWYLRLIMQSCKGFDHFQVQPITKFSVIVWHVVKGYLDLIPYFMGQRSMGCE